MALNFQSLPYENPEPTGHEQAQELGQNLNRLGQSFGQLNQRRDQAQQQELLDRIRQLQIESEYGTEGLDQVYGSPAAPPKKSWRSIFQGQGEESPGQVQPLPMAQPGQPGFDENAYRQRYGSKRLKMFQDGEDRRNSLEDRDLSRRNTESMISERGAKGRALAQNGGKPPAGYRWTPEMSLEAIPGGPAYMKAGEKSGDMNAAFKLYETARQGLLDGLRSTNTGPIMGRIPAVTSGQQIAQGGVAAMAPVLKQLFRVSGEGVFTDRDQQLLLDMIPTRTTNPDAITTQMENIDNIVKAKLRMTSNQGGEAGGSADPGEDASAARRARIAELKARQGRR